MNTPDPVTSMHSIRAPAPHAARHAYAMSLLLFTVYAIDVLAGKAASLAGSHLEWRLGDFCEFLVVLAMAVAFVAGLMLSENASGTPGTGSNE